MDQAEVNDSDSDRASPRMLAAGGSALVLAAWALAGRVPRGAWPRPPAWLLVWAGAAIALAALGNQRPLVSVLGFTVSLGGLNQAALFFGIALVSLVAATILVWTTSVSAISPLLRRLTGWAAAVRLARRVWLSCGLPTGGGDTVGAGRTVVSGDDVRYAAGLAFGVDRRGRENGPRGAGRRGG